MRTKIVIGFSALAWMWLLPTVVRAQQPTSRVIPFNNVATTIPASTPGQALTIQLWDAAATPPGTLLFSEAQTLDVDVTGAISFVFGSQTENGLNPANFPSGASRFLDVVDSTGASVLPSPPGRIPLNAVAFALSPGPVGPKGDKGDPGAQGPPGVVQAISPGDASIIVGGTAANPTVAVAANGITNANVANGALSPAKIAGTAATLGSNTFTGTQAVNGDLSATGNLTMVNSTGTQGNILKGGVLFLHNFPFGSGNTFLGQNAGNLTMSGGNNTGSGFLALGSNTTGSANTASGAFALQFNNTGNGNTANGVAALGANNTGSANTASGAFALQFNNTGNNNTASGNEALFSNVTGTDNTASGARALESNNGGGNTASGARALVFNTGGNNNTASGVGALSNNITGSNNTAVGAGAGVSVGNLTNATAIGSGAVVNASNKIRLGNGAVTVVETSGKVVASGGFNGACTTVFVPFGGGAVTVTCNQDVAETFASAEATEPGDLVVLVNQSSAMPTVRKSTRPYDSLLVGAVSTSPGLVFDRGETHLAGDNSKLITPEKTVVGLVGRVPVKVSLQNGPIAVGDPLTSSSTAGVAMKASGAGQIIGYALEKADQKGKILVHLQPGYYIPPKLLALLNQQDLLDGPKAHQAEMEELKSQLGKLQGLLQAVLAQRPEKSASVGAEGKVHKEALLTKAERANQATRAADVTK